MAYLMVHLEIANKIFAQYPHIDDKKAFRIGSIAPDTLGFKPGHKRSDKSLTHFCIGDEGWGYFTNYDEWHDNLINNIIKFFGIVNKDFLLGYISHIITDIENSRRFWTPTRLTDDADKISTWFNDCGEVDSILLSKIENIHEFWAGLDNTDHHFLPDVCMAEDIIYMVQIMKTEIYSNRYPNPEYTPGIFTMPVALNFIEDMADKTITIIKDLINKC